jgi:type II secretory pathway component GspD/PulD (secretin)
MRLFIFVVGLIFATAAQAEKMVDFYYKDAPLSEVIETYAKLSGKKFVVDPSVRGKADILNRERVPLSEALNLMSSALAVNGFAISDQQGTYVVMSARNVQRSFLPVTDTLPALKPERMVSFVYTGKHVTADDLNKELRVLASKDGEIVPIGNKLIFTDWVSNVHRIHKTLELVDRPDYKPGPNSGGR